MPLFWLHLKSIENKIKLQTYLDWVSTAIPQVGVLWTYKEAPTENSYNIFGVSVSELFDGRSTRRVRKVKIQRS
jgi:hypothetical protein